MRMTMKQGGLAVMLACALRMGHAAPVEQWASTVLGYSSQWSATGWGATQATGAPDTAAYGDFDTAWTPLSINGTLEYLTLGFDTKVYSTGALIRETWGNGFVTQVQALDTLGTYHTVWSGTDTSLPGKAVDDVLSWAQTSYLTTGLKIFVNTNHNRRTWEAIDAVKLYGESASVVPEPSAVVAALAGLGVVFAARRRRQAR
jgi:hypothetical protein